MIRRTAQQLMGWLPSGRASRSFLVIFFIDAVGTGLFLAGSALYFTRVIGISSSEVGVGLSLAAVTGLLCQVPLGKLADRFGSKRTLIALYVWRGLGFAAYLLVDDALGFIVVACVLGANQGTIGPLIQAMVGAAEESAARVRTMAAIVAVRNAGFAIGALLAIVAMATASAAGYRTLVIGNAVSFFVAVFMLARVPLRRTPAAESQAVERVVRVRDPRYLLLTGANGVLLMHSILLAVGIPLWLSTRTDAPTPVIGTVFFLNTALAMLLGVRLSRGAEGVRAGGARQHWAGWSMAACCVLLAPTADLSPALTSLLVLGAVVPLTLGEIWQSVGGWALSYALSPEDRRGYYLSFYNLGNPCAAIAGPVVLTVAVMPAGGAGWLCLAAVFAATGIAVRAIAGVGGARAAAPRLRLGADG